MKIITDKKGSSRYLPDSFSQSSSIKLAQGSLGPEQIICFSESDFDKSDE